MQFRIFFDGDAENAVRIDTFQVEFSPGLVSEAVGEVALATDPFPASGLLEVEGGIDTTFTYDIRTEFAEGVAGYHGIRIEAFPPPVFESLHRGDPLVDAEDFEWAATERGFDVFFAPVARGQQPAPADHLPPAAAGTQQPRSTPISSARGASRRIPSPRAMPSELVGTNATNAFAIQAQPELQHSAVNGHYLAQRRRPQRCGRH